MYNLGYGGMVVSWFERNDRASRKKSRGHSPLEPFKDRPWMTLALSIFIVLPHILNNGMDVPITFFDLIFDARS